MRVSLKEMKKWSVETQSGDVLGAIHDVICDTDGQLIAQYIVRSSMIGGAVYTVHRDQVVRYESKKMIVSDALATAGEQEEQASRRMPDPEPIAMRE